MRRGSPLLHAGLAKPGGILLQCDMVRLASSEGQGFSSPAPHSNTVTCRSQPSVSYKTNAVKTTARGYRVIDFGDGGRVEIHFPAYYLKGEAGGWRGVGPEGSCAAAWRVGMVVCVPLAPAASACRRASGQAVLGPPARTQQTICMPRLHTPTRKQPPPTLSAGLLYTSAPRGELTGTAEFVDAANGLQAVVTFGPIEGARSSALRRPDAFSGSIYLQQARAPLERQASGGVPDSGWVMPTSGDKVRGGRLLLCCAGKVCMQANSSMRSHAMPLAHPCICPTMSPCARPSGAPPASAASAP